MGNCSCTCQGSPIVNEDNDNNLEIKNEEKDVYKSIRSIQREENVSYSPFEAEKVKDAESLLLGTGPSGEPDPIDVNYLDFMKDALNDMIQVSEVKDEYVERF